MSGSAFYCGFLTLSLINSVFGGADAHPSSANCTWKYIEQPLSHFARGIASSYKQRLCVFSDYWTPDKGLPVFLYTGNESPVDEYVNNTGLIWDLASSEHALVVFAEHRYFGESIPQIEGMDNCLAHLSSQEALADYASLANRIRRDWGGKDSAIIAFGGSYGGMLASWLRIMYPSAVDGAIAASAPVWGLPLDGCAVDSSSTVVTYAASPAAGSSARCADNLKASYVLLSDIGSTEAGRSTLSSAMGLCSPLTSTADITALLSYLQSPLFDLSEGSYPFPSDYITFALTGTTNPLPPWAMQVMCAPLGQDFGVALSGQPSEVDFTVTAGGVQVKVDWDKTSNNKYTQADVTASGAPSLLAAVAQSIQVWYNVSADQPSCIDWQDTYAKVHAVVKDSDSVASAQSLPARSLSKTARRTARSPAATAAAAKYVETSATGASDAASTCTLPAASLDAGTAWNALVCSESINLVNWWAQGVGNDLYWPPNQAKGATFESLVPGSLAFCPYLKGLGLYGVPEKGDDWSFWLDTVYGGTRLQYASNIVYSNGNLDPWSPAGVTADAHHKTHSTAPGTTSTTRLAAQPKSLSNDGSVVSVVIDMGGHHLDLFWPTEQDPLSVREVRELEKTHILRWIEEVAQRNAV